LKKQHGKIDTTAFLSARFRTYREYMLAYNVSALVPTNSDPANATAIICEEMAQHIDATLAIFPMIFTSSHS
jgi:hypothetical protein